MAFAVLAVVKIAYSWPLVHDAPLIHYVVFLMDNGWSPYRDIVEMNMPGAYVTEAWAMRLFGGDAFGWWLWDAVLGLVVIAGSLWIAGAHRKWAGLVAGSLTYITHLSEGPANLGQRDWAVTALLILSVAFLFEAIRKRQPVWMVGFMFLCGAAASIKPPAILPGGLLLIAACWQQCNALRFAGRVTLYKRIGAMVAWSIAGGLVAAAVVIGYLVRWGTFNDLVGLLKGLLPYYTGLHRVALMQLAKGAFVYPILVIPALFIFFGSKSWKKWDSNFLILASAAGTLMFFIQDKGWVYHLYTERAFVALWATLELERTLNRGVKWEQGVAIAALAVTLLFTTPKLVLAAHRAVYPVESFEHLNADLADLGGPKLSGQVQCLDMTMGGCINALYRQHIVQSTGFIYDYYLFPKVPTAVTRSLQDRFMKEVYSSEPGLIIISSHTWPADVFGYDQINNWPDFKKFLEKNYYIEREYKGENSLGYRIYALKGA
jgi:hypothetical protein